jgi:hypothetical protein
MKTAIVRAFALLSVGICAWCAGPQLTPQQIQAAIARGKQYNNTAEMLLACLDPRYSSSAHVQWHHLCDGIPTGRLTKQEFQKYAMFFNDFVAVAAPSAANQKMGELKPTDVDSSGYNFASELQAIAVGPSQSAVSVVEFAFDVSPQVLQCPVELTLIDENGKKHQREVNLAGVVASLLQRLRSSPVEIC